MPIRPSITSGARRIVNNRRCVVCLYRSPLSVRSYTIKQRLDPRKGTPQEVRADIDERNRRVYYRMLEADKLIPCKLEDANKIVNHFVSNRANKMDPATNVHKLAQHYKLEVIHLPMLAIPMFRIPDVNDTNAQLPPSQNSPVAASLLLACSAAGDLQATLQILNAVYYASKVHNMPKAVEIARLFTPKDINDCRKMLEQLAEGKDDKGAAKGDANAMTLHGKFLELAGNKEEARYFYEKALERYNTKMFRGYPHPMALPWLTPWTELVNLEETSPTPSIEKMSEALKFGAMKADDPMAYYKLATLQDTKSPEWLKYMSKAAASGHPEAMYRLGQFYHEVNARPSDLLNDAGFKKVLKFLTSWKRNASADFGMEWLKAAAMGGHKPAMLEMAQLYEQTKQEDAIEQSMDCLKAIVKEPPPGVREEWPHLVMQARQRLAGLQRARKDQRQFA